MHQNSASVVRVQLPGMSTVIPTSCTLWTSVHNHTRESSVLLVDGRGNVENQLHIGLQRRRPAFPVDPIVDNLVNDWGSCPHSRGQDVGNLVIHISTRLITTTTSFKNPPVPYSY